MKLPDSILAAILAAPDDDVPRMHAADWFAENGQDERAEFIRGQMAPLYSLEWYQAERRWLTPTNRWKWAGRVGRIISRYGWRQGERVEYRRGFIEAIRIPWHGWQDHCGDLRGACPLREVRLTTWPEVDVRPHDYLPGTDYVTIDADPPILLMTYSQDARDHNQRSEFILRHRSRRWPGITFTLPPTIMTNDGPAYLDVDADGVPIGLRRQAVVDRR